MNRLKDVKLTTITSRDGLYDNLAFAILEDEHGNFWMSGNKGIYRANGAELNDFADGRIGCQFVFLRNRRRNDFARVQRRESSGLENPRRQPLVLDHRRIGEN